MVMLSQPGYGQRNPVLIQSLHERCCFALTSERFSFLLECLEQSIGFQDDERPEGTVSK